MTATGKGWDAVREHMKGTGPAVACFGYWEKPHPKPLTNRDGVEMESSYIEKAISTALYPTNGRWLIAPYVTPAKRRLGRDPIGAGTTLEMRLLVARITDPEGQRDEFKHVVRVRDEWPDEETGARITRLVDELHPFVWSDPSGMMLAWTLAEPFVITTAADAKRWAEWFFAVRKHLSHNYKITIEADGAGFDALFPAPTGEPGAGDRHAVPAFTAVPFPATMPAAAPAKPPAEEDAKARVADVQNLLTMIEAASRERAAKLSESEAATLLAACSGDLPSEVQWTQYEAGKTDTTNGAARSESFAAFGAMLADYAGRVVAKGTGRSFIGAVSRSGRCRDADLEAITLLTFDCDGAGEWHRVRRVLDEAGLAYIVQRSSSHTPEKPKWHLSLPLARPWSGDKPAWRAIFRFLVGTFAGIAEVLGFDNSTDRLMQPIFPAARRTKDQAPPETIVVSGRALDLDELLARGGFDPAWRTARTAYEPREPSSVAPSDGLLALAFGRAAMLGPRIERDSIKGFACECPRERLHSSGQRFDGSTMLADPSGPAGKGYFLCLHAHCGNMKPEAALAGWA